MLEVENESFGRPKTRWMSKTKASESPKRAGCRKRKLRKAQNALEVQNESFGKLPASPGAKRKLRKAPGVTWSKNEGFGKLPASPGAKTKASESSRDHLEQKRKLRKAPGVTWRQAKASPRISSAHSRYRYMQNTPGSLCFRGCCVWGVPGVAVCYL